MLQSSSYRGRRLDPARPSRRRRRRPGQRALRRRPCRRSSTAAAPSSAPATAARPAPVTRVSRHEHQHHRRDQPAGIHVRRVLEHVGPAGWGLDAGGWVYRESNNDPVFDPATLASNGDAVPGRHRRRHLPAGDCGRRQLRQLLGYEINPNANLASHAVVDQPFGSGHAIMLGFDPWYRAWTTEEERLVLNAIFYPTGTAIPAGPTSAEPARSRRMTTRGRGRSRRPARAPWRGPVRPAGGGAAPQPALIVSVRARPSRRRRRPVDRGAPLVTASACRGRSRPRRSRAIEARIGCAAVMMPSSQFRSGSGGEVLRADERPRRAQCRSRPRSPCRGCRSRTAS